MITVVFTVYLSLVMTHRIQTVVQKGAAMRVFRYELLACVIIFLCALDLRSGIFTLKGTLPLKMLGWLLRIAAVTVTAVLLYFIGRVTAGSFIRSKPAADNALVLGLALENGRPADDLLKRLDTAEKYLKENPEAVLILTGGNPDDTGRTEAMVMREVLTAHGIAEEKLRMEDRAKTTWENFRNAAKMVDTAKPVAVITSNYHMDRAVLTAQRAGFTAILRYPAPSSFAGFGANVMWEVIAELSGLLRKL